MDDASAGEYRTLVVRLQQGDDGGWRVSLDDPGGTQSYVLSPATLVLRLWRVRKTGVLRGRIRLAESERTAPIQITPALAELVRAWLAPGDRQSDT